LDSSFERRVSLGPEIDADLQGEMTSLALQLSFRVLAREFELELPHQEILYWDRSVYLQSQKV
jgi:hypothetical protein